MGWEGWFGGGIVLLREVRELKIAPVPQGDGREILPSSLWATLFPAPPPP